jgi:hypothetical protein
MRSNTLGNGVFSRFPASLERRTLFIPTTVNTTKDVQDRKDWGESPLRLREHGDFFSDPKYTRSDSDKEILFNPLNQAGAGGYELFYPSFAAALRISAARSGSFAA